MEDAMGHGPGDRTGSPKTTWRWVLAGAGALMCMGTALAQETPANTQATPPVIGPPQLKDFQLEPRERIVTQPTPQPKAEEPAQTPEPAPRRADPPTPAAGQPAPRGRVPETRPTPAAPVRVAPPGDAPAAAPSDADIQNTLSPLPPVADSAPLPQTAPAPTITPAPVTEAQPDEGTPTWPFVLLGLLALVGGAFVLRRRKAEAPETVYQPDASDVAPTPPLAALTAAPRQPAPAPKPAPPVQAERPWIELEIRPERVSFTDKEALVHFELLIRNTGPVNAQDMRIDVKMINAGQQQDQEIGTFFQTAGRDTTKLALPGMAAGAEGVIKATVGMPIEEMRAIKLDQRTLFIPVVAVNALYAWGEGQSGQSSKSYIVGRELQQPSEKMGAFQLDKGPRIWRQVGLRPHKLEVRV